MTITLYTDVRLSPVIYRDAPNWKRKLVENSNDNNFLLGCPTESRNISRCSKCKMEARIKFNRQRLFTQISDRVLLYIQMLQFENGSSYQIQTTITFYSDVWLSPVIYRDTQNLDPKLWENWIDNNFIQGCPVESCNISRRSKLKTEAHRKFKRQ